MVFSDYDYSDYHKQISCWSKNKIIPSNLHVRPSLVSDHLLQATVIQKHQNFPSQSLIVGISSKRPPPVSDRDHFLGLTVNEFPFFATT